MVSHSLKVSVFLFNLIWMWSVLINRRTALEPTEINETLSSDLCLISWAWDEDQRLRLKPRGHSDVHLTLHRTPSSVTPDQTNLCEIIISLSTHYWTHYTQCSGHVDSISPYCYDDVKRSPDSPLCLINKHMQYPTLFIRLHL